MKEQKSELVTQIIEHTEAQQQQEQAPESNYEKLMRLGLTKAAGKIAKMKKMKIAYLNFLYVSSDKLALFNDKLRKETLLEDKRAYRYKQLKFVLLKDYPELPPPSVLEALENAKKFNCFDSYEIAKIDWIEQIKDPILFGVIEGCSDKFFISQWDDDVKFEDIFFSE